MKDFRLDEVAFFDKTLFPLIISEHFYLQHALIEDRLLWWNDRRFIIIPFQSLLDASLIIIHKWVSLLLFDLAFSVT